MVPRNVFQTSARDLADVLWFLQIVQMQVIWPTNSPDRFYLFLQILPSGLMCCPLNGFVGPNRLIEVFCFLFLRAFDSFSRLSFISTFFSVPCAAVGFRSSSSNNINNESKVGKAQGCLVGTGRSKYKRARGRDVDRRMKHLTA